ncbi:MAG: hypothetical protein QM669_12375 [Siphonobacter sp.]
MSKSRFKSCYLSDLAKAAGVDVRTFWSWVTPEDREKVRELGHSETDRKLRPKVVAFLLNEYLPELAHKDFLEGS